MNTKFLTFFLLAFIPACLFSQNWQDAWDNTDLTPADPHYFGTPHVQSCANDGWEDGLYITRDGLNLYSFYFPGEFFKLIGDLGDPFESCLMSATTYQDRVACCPDNMSDYYTGPLVGVDTIIDTAQYSFLCINWYHSDIIHASRASTCDTFGDWDTIAISEWQQPWFEGGPAAYQEDGVIEQFVYSQNINFAGNDLYITCDPDINGTNPGPGKKLDFSDPNIDEDNPHIEKVASDPDLYLLLFDSHAGVDEGSTFFTFSSDPCDTSSWDDPDTLVRPLGKHVQAQPHFWQDPKDNTWWLYFGAPYTVGSVTTGAIYRTKFNGSFTMAGFDNFGSWELVLSLNEVDHPDYSSFGVGEPTLTANGDLSFIVAYDYNKDGVHIANADPWIIPRCDSAFVSGPDTITDCEDLTIGIGGTDSGIITINGFTSPVIDLTNPPSSISIDTFDLDSTGVLSYTGLLDPGDYTICFITWSTSCQCYDTSCIDVTVLLDTSFCCCDSFYANWLYGAVQTTKYDSITDTSQVKVLDASFDFFGRNAGIVNNIDLDLDLQTYTPALNTGFGHSWSSTGNSLTEYFPYNLDMSTNDGFDFEIDSEVPRLGGVDLVTAVVTSGGGTGCDDTLAILAGTADLEWSNIGIKINGTSYTPAQSSLTSTGGTHFIKIDAIFSDLTYNNDIEISGTIKRDFDNDGNFDVTYTQTVKYNLKLTCVVH